MSVAPDSYSFIKAKASKEEIAASYWERCGSVMLPERLSVPNTRITAPYADNRAVGSGFAPYHPLAGDHDQERVNKACVAYLNISMGITALLGVTSNRKIVYPNWSVRDRYRIPFPYWEELSAAQIERLAGAYDELGDAPMLPLREMLRCCAHALERRGGRDAGAPGGRGGIAAGGAGVGSRR